MTDKRDRIWGWFDTIAEMEGGWEEFDEPVRRALTEIEQLPGLPDDFAIPYIKLKEGVGMRIEFDNAGDCNNAVWDIVSRVEAETWPLMIQRNQRQENKEKGPMTPEQCREQFYKMIGMEVYCDEPNRVVPPEEMAAYSEKSWAVEIRELFTPEERAEIDARIDQHIDKFGLTRPQADEYRENYWKWEIREREQENRRKAWDFALGMIRVDGLEIKSPEFMDLIEKEIRGEISDEELLAYIKKTYGAEPQGSIEETLVGVLKHDYASNTRVAEVSKKLMEQNQQAYDTLAGEPLCFQSSLTMEEVEKNFEGVSVYDGLMAGLKEAAEYERQQKELKWSYPAVLSYEQGKEIAVVFPDLDVATSGINEADALFSAQELLRCVLHGLRDDGKPFPAQTALEDVPVGQNEKAVLVATEIDPELDPRDHGANCPGNGENGNPCCCDECEFGLDCFGEDIAAAQEAYEEYVKDGCRSRPIEELWKELNLE